MTKDEFWSLIEDSRGADENEFLESLRTRLSALPSEKIIEFEQQINDRLVETYRWDLWAVAYIVHGGCSDDGFDYFRGWLIAQGREYFEAALNNPERAADKAEPDHFYECGGVLSAAFRAFQKVTSQEMPLNKINYPETGPAG